VFSFTCNVCNSACSVDSEADVGREKPSCSTCGSCARFRWIIHALSLELFGQSVPLPLFPLAKDLAGIGLTDSPSIADRLVEQLNYTNTFYHQEPRIDIMDLTSGVDSAYDFIIASEVFEHLPPPVQPAFNNLWRLLRPDGLIVFTVPWSPDGHTKEHFPDLYDWQVAHLRSGSILVNRNVAGEIQLFEDLCFHGGPGETLEMRLFAKSDLIEHFQKAGFQAVEFAESYPEYGIVCEPWSRGLVARKTVRRPPWVPPPPPVEVLPPNVEIPPPE
jgi:SAM-dependent methyltransferase